MAVPVNNLFGGEEYVKIKKSDWNTIVDAFSRAVSRNHLLEKYEKKIAGLEHKISILSEQVEKLKRFVASQGLGEAFVEFVKSLAPKSLKQRMEEKKIDSQLDPKGDKATFIVQVQFRQNATWQGTVQWVEKGVTQRFRSELELMKLMAEAAETEEMAKW